MFVYVRYVLTRVDLKGAEMHWQQMYIILSHHSAFARRLPPCPARLPASPAVDNGRYPAHIFRRTSGLQTTLFEERRFCSRPLGEWQLFRGVA